MKQQRLIEKYSSLLEIIAAPQPADILRPPTTHKIKLNTLLLLQTMANFQKVQDERILVLTRPLKSYLNYIQVSENHRALVVNCLRPQYQENLLIPVHLKFIWPMIGALSTRIQPFFHLLNVFFFLKLGV